MEYRRVGTTGLRVSALSIGGWITFGGSIDDRAATGIVRTALDGGINFIDLADVYAHGRAEKTFGRMLTDLRRADLVVSSKVFFPISEAPNDRGLSRKHIVESVERSLRHLGTDYLDLYFCHRPDPETPIEETAAAMDDLVHQGKILYWGTSMWSSEALREAHGIADRRRLYAPIVEQPKYNLLQRKIEADVMPTAKELGMGLVVYSPLAGGMLTGKYDTGIPQGSRADTTSWLENVMTEENAARVRELGAIARVLGAETGQLALAALLRRAEISSVITGATRSEQLASNLKAAELEIPADVSARIDALCPA